MAQVRAAQEERLALARSVGDRGETIGALYGLGLALVDDVSTSVEAGTLFEESLALARKEGHRRGMAAALSCLALLAQKQNAHERALSLLEEGLEHYQMVGDAWAATRMQFNIALCHRRLGNDQRAQELCAVLLPVYASLQDTRGVAAVEELLGRLAIARRDYAQATAHLQASLRPFLELDARGQLVDVLEQLAIVAAACGEPAWCMRLLGAADALLISIGQPPDDHAALIPNLAKVESTLGLETSAAILEEGRVMTAQQAVAGAEALCVALARAPLGAP
jgi:tetratricopeptide (TPR) repeat protein